MLKIKCDINQQDLKRVDLHFVKSDKFLLTWSCGSRQRDTTSSGWKFKLNNLAVKRLKSARHRRWRKNINHNKHPDTIKVVNDFFYFNCSWSNDWTYFMNCFHHGFKNDHFYFSIYHFLICKILRLRETKQPAEIKKNHYISRIEADIFSQIASLSSVLSLSGGWQGNLSYRYGNEIFLRWKSVKATC